MGTWSKVCEHATQRHFMKIWKLNNQFHGTPNTLIVGTMPQLDQHKLPSYIMWIYMHNNKWIRSSEMVN